MFWSIAKVIVYIATGEFLLHGRANGGTVIFLRALITTIVLFTLAILLEQVLSPDTRAGDGGVRGLIAGHLPWAGAIFAGTYAALYSRFASQWSYLAETYNQLMATRAQAPFDGTPERKRTYALWMAGILEDAYTLHLATKKMFAPLVADFLEEAAVAAAFKATSMDTTKRVQLLQKRLKTVLGRDIGVGTKEKLLAWPPVEPNAGVSAGLYPPAS